VGRQSRPWVADQITNRLWALKTGSALKNRTIKARMYRAFRMAFYAPTIHRLMREGSAGFIFAGAARNHGSASRLTPDARVAAVQEGDLLNDR
jgi:hypothetical protein